MGIRFCINELDHNLECGVEVGDKRVLSHCA